MEVTKSIVKEMEKHAPTAAVEKLCRAIAAMEGATKIDRTVIKSLGSGSPMGLLLSECTTAAEKEQARTAILAGLIATDKSLVRTFGHGEDVKERRRTSALALGRIVTAVVGAIATEDDAGSGASIGSKNGVTSYVVTQTEEERGFSIPDLSNEDVKDKSALVEKMCGRKLRPHDIGSLPACKKVGYWVLEEHCWPDPKRVPLSVMRRDPTDSHYTLFRRMALTVAMFGAGVKASASARDEGAGDTKHFGKQWMKLETVFELLDELEEVRDRTVDATMGGVTAIMHLSLFKGTTRGNETGSLAVSRQMCKVTEHVATAAGAAKPPGETTPTAQTGRKRKRGGTASKAAETAARPRTAEKPRPEAGKKYEDKEGAKGPNELPRKKGGNPAGGPCKYIVEGKTCPFKTCSFSHAGE